MLSNVDRVKQIMIMVDEWTNWKILDKWIKQIMMTVDKWIKQIMSMGGK